MLLGVGLRSAPHASGSYGSSHTRLRRPRPTLANSRTVRSEEHTSELQSRSDLVCRLLLEKKKNNALLTTTTTHTPTAHTPPTIATSYTTARTQQATPSSSRIAATIYSPTRYPTVSVTSHF